MSLQNAGFFGSALNWYMKSSLILLICIGMVLGVFLGVVAPSYAGSFSLFGRFVCRGAESYCSGPCFHSCLRFRDKP